MKDEAVCASTCSLSSPLVRGDGVAPFSSEDPLSAGLCLFPCPGVLYCSERCIYQGLLSGGNPADSRGSWTLTHKPLGVQGLPPSCSFLAFWCVLTEAPRQLFGSSQPRGLRGVSRGATSGSVNFFVAPQRMSVLELGSRLRFFKARQQICFKFGSRQRRAGGRNFPGIALHFPLKGLCFGAGD